MFLIQLYIDSVSRLQAADNLQRIMEVGVGTGSVKDGKAIQHSLARAANKDSMKVKRADPSTLGAMGIGVQRWQKN